MRSWNFRRFMWSKFFFFGLLYFGIYFSTFFPSKSFRSAFLMRIFLSCSPFLLLVSVAHFFSCAGRHTKAIVNMTKQARGCAVSSVLSHLCFFRSICWQSTRANFLDFLSHSTRNGCSIHYSHICEQRCWTSSARWEHKQCWKSFCSSIERKKESTTRSVCTDRYVPRASLSVSIGSILVLVSLGRFRSGWF